MQLIKNHLEWVVFFGGLIALAFMNPQNTGTSFCILDLAGIEFCPGEGLGHSISYTFRGDLDSAFNAHLFGPFAVVILSLRIIQIWYNIILDKKSSLINRDNNG